jgi:Ran GTPase-activating protein (RanGAP) involved in mRNA processing and transport
LKNIDLSFNALGSDSARLIPLCPYLHKVDLAGNDIDPQGVEWITESLKTNSCLTHLDMSGNRIGDRGAHLFANLIQINDTLEYLNLASNDIERFGAQVLAQALARNQTLQYLSLWFNTIGDEGGRAFEECLQVNHTLQTIHLDRRVSNTIHQSLKILLERNRDWLHQHRRYTAIQVFEHMNRRSRIGMEYYLLKSLLFPLTGF